MKHLALRTLWHAKRLVVIVMGFTILAAGVAMIVLPGPAVVVIPVGLALLATEFLWARKLLVTLKEQVERMRKGVRCPNSDGISRLFRSKIRSHRNQPHQEEII